MLKLLSPKWQLILQSDNGIPSVTKCSAVKDKLTIKGKLSKASQMPLIAYYVSDFAEGLL